MTKEEFEKKKDASCRDCDTCEFKVVPLRIEPCRSCNNEQDNWTASRLYVGGR